MNDGLPKGDFNMPPGVRAYMIPGNAHDQKDEIEGHCKWCGEVLSAEDYNCGECPNCGGEP